jgi:Undecaprenyl-phosphate glucose phosphotransferase
MGQDPQFNFGVDGRRKRQMPISSAVISTITLLFDSAAIILSGLALYRLRINFSSETLTLYTAAILAVWVTVIILFRVSDLYRFEAILKPTAHFDRIIISFATAFLFILAAAFAFKISSTLSRLYIAMFAASALPATVLARLILSQIIIALTRRGRFTRNMILVGDETHIERLKECIENSQLPFINIKALFVPKAQQRSVAGLPVMGDETAVASFVRNFQVDDVVIAKPWSDEAGIHGMIEALRELPVNIYLGADLIGLSLPFHEPPSHFAGAPFFSVVGRPLSGWGVAIKALEDYVLSLLFVLIAAIPMAIFALLIKIDSPGPVFFRQKRLGFNNRMFDIYKFRTMRYEKAAAGRTIQASKNDPRITRIGKWLRRTSMDELPQLFNVLQGNMSLVGPRPHALDHNAEFSQRVRGYFGRHRVKPGITGWAQVNGFRGEIQTPELMESRVRFDIHYAENWSLLFDLKIVLLTVFVLFTGRNAY